MVSGSFPDSADPADLPHRQKIERLSRAVGSTIAKRGKRLVSGYGLVVGSAAISGALSVILAEETPNMERSLLLRPFPREAPAGTDAADFKRVYREGMIQQSGACVVICGLKDSSTRGHMKRIIGNGTLDEAGAALAAGRAVIPVGASGGAAAEVWKLHDKVFLEHWPKSLRSEFNVLNDEAVTEERLLQSIERFLDHLDSS
jgi:hypothetical protein